MLQGTDDVGDNNSRAREKCGLGAFVVGGAVGVVVEQEGLKISAWWDLVWKSHAEPPQRA